ncbi:MAG TPA: hypothetical protein VGH13_01130 [Xanthobacteraceae bacterium]|jgi:hypothetical protein
MAATAVAEMAALSFRIPVLCGTRPVALTIGVEYPSPLEKYYDSRWLTEAERHARRRLAVDKSGVAAWRGTQGVVADGANLSGFSLLLISGAYLAISEIWGR